MTAKEYKAAMFHVRTFFNHLLELITQAGGTNWTESCRTFQMIIGLGTQPEVFGLPPKLHFGLLTLFWLLLHIHDALWEPLSSTEAVLNVVHKKILCMMKLFRKLFQRISKCGCKNSKYHDCLHLISTMKELASLRLTYTGPGEQKNKVVKATFKTTSRKRKRLEEQIFRRGEQHREVRQQLREAGGSYLFSDVPPSPNCNYFLPWFAF